MDANEALDTLYQIAEDDELAALDLLMIRAGFRSEEGEMADVSAMTEYIYPRAG